MMQAPSTSVSNSEGKRPEKRQRMNFNVSPRKSDSSEHLDIYWQEICFNWEERKADKSIPKDPTGGLQLVIKFGEKTPPSINLKASQLRPPALRPRQPGPH